MSTVDEDGLCRLTELPPEQCGCDHHRGALLDGADEAIIDALVRPELFGGSSAVDNRRLARAHDDELKDNGRLGNR